MKQVVLALTVAALAPLAHAELTAAVVSEPTARKDSISVWRTGLESNLAKVAGRSVQVTMSDDLTDAMRATRSGGYDIFIAPAQVAASALSHGYELVGATDGEDQFVLVAKTRVKNAAELRKARVYLPQQDSLYTYLARGMLTSAGLSFKDLGRIEYARYPQAGLTALQMGVSEATVVRKGEWDEWTKSNSSDAHIISSTSGVPGGFSVVVKKNLPPDVKLKLARWFQTSATSVGLKNATLTPEPARYQRVAELGTFTPTALPGAQVVTAVQVAQLIQQGAVVVDTRNEKEFKAKTIPGARWVPYHEKSLKDVAYDASQDDFSGLASLDPQRPVVFHCNGAECWKSYKASKAAVAKGFKQVYWFRGGLPEWEKANQQMALAKESKGG